MHFELIAAIANAKKTFVAGLFSHPNASAWLPIHRRLPRETLLSPLSRVIIALSSIIRNSAEIPTLPDRTII
jgi:hypothetical protein